jgi:hypothetical protein
LYNFFRIGLHSLGVPPLAARHSSTSQPKDAWAFDGMAAKTKTDKAKAKRVVFMSVLSLV